jgi:hypothetical protein
MFEGSLVNFNRLGPRYYCASSRSSRATIEYDPLP